MTPTVPMEPDAPRRRDLRGVEATHWNSGLWSSWSAEWETPADVRALIDAEFGTDFDPCPIVLEGLRDRDGLSSWHGRVFCNPPYGRALPKWLEHGLQELEKRHCEIIVWLLPARTDTSWFHDLVVPNATRVRFLRGRPSFRGRAPARPAPFPSMIVVMGGP